MREILFRGFHSDKNGKEKVFVNGKWINGFWVFGYYVKAKYHWHKYGIHEDFIVASCFQNGGYFNVAGRYAVVPETVGQYTGLKDKNGKEIYEEDIIKSKYAFSSIVGEVKFGNFRNDDYGYDFYGYAFVSKDSTGENLVLQLYKGWKGLEIIGNIFENPELLKGDEE